MRAPRILALSLLLLLPTMAATPASGAGFGWVLSDDERVLDASQSAEGIKIVVIEAGVGEINVTGDATKTITARVELSPKTGFWGSRGRRAVESAELVPVLRGDTLTLKVGPRDEDHQFGEDWDVHVPPDVEVKIELGVGDVKVLDTLGDIDVDLGVGDVRIESEYKAFGPIHGSIGVGDATLRTPEGREEGSGFISHNLRGRGPGQSSINISIGVGESQVRLR
ncbi:MAG: hypothetical protein MUF10_05245 [Thermoanaerobaculaceae bacterium]|nr:hypothetical protein [Thermoanaerobaculaceae bacterium]